MAATRSLKMAADTNANMRRGYRCRHMCGASCSCTLLRGTGHSGLVTAGTGHGGLVTAGTAHGGLVTAGTAHGGLVTHCEARAQPTVTRTLTRPDTIHTRHSTSRHSALRHDCLLRHKVTWCAVVLLHLIHAAAADNMFSSFTNCDRPRNDVFVIDGATVTSQTEGLPISNNLNCSHTFQAVVPYRYLLLQITQLNVAMRRNEACIDELSIYESDSHVILHKFCGTFADLPETFSNGKLYTEDSYLKVSWQTGQRSNRGQDVAFTLTLTALKQTTDNCDAATQQFTCSERDCMSESLVCDGVAHCRDARDEAAGCVQSIAMDSLTGYGDTTTTKKPVKILDVTTTAPLLGTEQVFLWLPLIVVIVFTAVMIALITIGRRKEANPEPTNDDRNELSVDVEGNAGYEAEPGQPSTPPPSYSVLERQISYVSHISQSSSQIDEPPDYSDALDLPGDGGRVARSASALGQRRRSSSAGSRISRLRNRLFSRSVSANEPSSRRNDSSNSTEPPEIPESRDPDYADVFIDFSSSRPQGHSTPHPSSTSSQSTTQNSSGARNLNSSQLTTISSIDENDIGSTPSIFDHINQLNETTTTQPEVSDNINAEDASGSREESDMPHCVSNVALLTNEGAPNNGPTSTA